MQDYDLIYGILNNLSIAAKFAFETDTRFENTTIWAGHHTAAGCTILRQSAFLQFQEVTI